MSLIIDSHCHIYPEKIASKAVESIGDFYHLPMGFDGRSQTLIKVGENSGVNHFVIFSVATTPKQVHSINNFISDNVRTYKNKMTGLGALHPNSENMKEDVAQIVSLGLKGVKLHPDVQKFRLDDEKCDIIYKLCIENDLPLLLHCGDSRYDFSNPNRLIKVLEKFPELKVIGAHFGGWSIWEEASQLLYKYPNLSVDCSSALPYLKYETVEKIISLYTPERVLFASDFPMWNPKDNIEYLEKLALSKEDKEKIFYANAKKLFKIAI